MNKNDYERIEKVANEENWTMGTYEDAVKDDAIYFYQYSPAGENFSFCITFTEKGEWVVDEVQRVANDFDEDEHFEMWAEARNSVSGVPDIRTLIKDAHDIHNMITDLGVSLGHLEWEEN